MCMTSTTSWSGSAAGSSTTGVLMRSRKSSGNLMSRRPPMARSDGIDELDPRFPIGFTLPPAVFDRLLAHPPVTAPWRSRLEFTVDAAKRAFAQDAALASARTFRQAGTETAPMPVIRVEARRTLAAVFTACALAAAYEWRKHWRNRKRKRAAALAGAKSRARIAALVARVREAAKPRRVLRPVPGG